MKLMNGWTIGVTNLLLVSACNLIGLLLVLPPLVTLASDEVVDRAVPSDTSSDPAQDSRVEAVKSPLTPDDERRSFQLADSSLSIELAAAEPDVVSPVALAWDRQGRMYVAEMIGYPSTSEAGRIRRLEDRDGDGRYEHATVFADRISFPTSVLPYRNGVLVTAAPDILFLQDTDGDGVADESHVEWTGFGADSQQLRSNALHWGIDNWIYGANGRCNGEIRRPGSQRPSISIRARDFRFRPKTGQFQAITGQSQFGQAHDDWGNRFLSWNQIPIRQALLEERYLKRAPQFGSRSVVNIASPNDLGRVFPISPPPQTFYGERPGYYNSTCGLTVFRGNALGAAYQGDAFFCETLYNVVVRRKLIPSGPTFTSEYVASGKEFLASTDGWFHPAFLATGPDGALYVADFYRKFIEHPRYVSPELREKYDWRKGYQHGRIWRIRKRDVPAVSQPFDELQQDDVGELVALLEHPVGWWRDAAQRRLVELADKQATSLLRQLARHGDAPTARVHALWTLDGLQTLDDVLLVDALSDPSPPVREHAIRLSEPRLAGSQLLQDALPALVHDLDPRVRFQLALTCGAAGSSLRHKTLSAIMASKVPGPWTTLAILLAAGPEMHKLLSSVFRSQPEWLRSPDPDQVHFLINAGKLLGGSEANDDSEKPIELLVDRQAAGSPRTLQRGHLMLLAGFARGLSERGESPRSVLQKLFQQVSATSPSAADVAHQAGEILVDSSASDVEREAAIDLLVVGNAEYVEETLVSLVAAEPVSRGLATAAIGALSALNRSEASDRLYDNWEQSPLWYRRAVLQTSQESAAAQVALVEALEHKTVVPTEVPLEIESALRRVKGDLGPRVSAMLMRPGSDDRRRVIENYVSSTQISGDRQQGARIFRQNCLACHTVLRIGHALGPDLAAVAKRDKRELLVDILDPNRQVSPDFTSYTLVASSGKVFVGLIVSEISGAVTLRRENAETVTVQRADIDELQATGQSLMPVGFEKRMDVEAMANLLAFLQQPDRRMLEQ